eukprot:gene41244-65286_t
MRFRPYNRRKRQRKGSEHPPSPDKGNLSSVAPTSVAKMPGSRQESEWPGSHWDRIGAYLIALTAAAATRAIRASLAARSTVDPDRKATIAKRRPFASVKNPTSLQAGMSPILNPL